MPIPVRITTGDANVAGGVMDSQIGNIDLVLADSTCSGGVLPITPAGYAAAMINSDPADFAKFAAWYMYGTGQTNVLGACSQWNDISGNGRHLAQGTAGRRPTINSDGSLTLDGLDDGMQALFTLSQPYSFYIVLTQLGWTANRYVFDGGTGNTALIQDDLGASPDLEIFAGTRLRPLAGPAIGTRAVVSGVFNNASSILRLNGGTELTGKAGATNAGGITLGCALIFDGSLASNIRVWEIILRTGSDSAADRQRIINYLRNKYRTA
jgi:hypothetical protein